MLQCKDSGEANITEHFYRVALENAVPQSPGIQGDNKNHMTVYDQVEGKGLNSTETYEDPDAGVKVHKKVTDAKTSGHGKQNTIIPAKYSKLQQSIPKEKTHWESTLSEGDYNVADSRPYQDKSKIKQPEDVNDEMPKNGNDPSELYTQPNKARKRNEELYVNHDQVDPNELYAQPDKKKKIKKPPPYAPGCKSNDPEALYTAVDKVKKRKN